MTPEATATSAAAIKTLKPLLGEAIQELALLITDEVRLWRWSRQLKIVDRARKILEERGIEPKPIYLKVLVPLLDAASLEEEPELEEMWAKLLASASENNTEKSFYFVATEILKNLSGREVISLGWMYGKWKVEADGLRHRTPIAESDDVYIKEDAIKFDVKEMIGVASLSLNRGKIMVDNLMRLNLIRYEPLDVSDDNFALDVRVTLPELMQLTHLAIRLMEVCGANNQKASKL